MPLLSPLAGAAAVRSLPLPSVSWNPPAAPLTRRNSGAAALSIPKELWRLVDAIYRNGLTEKDLFILPGRQAGRQGQPDRLESMG